MNLWAVLSHPDGSTSPSPSPSSSPLTLSPSTATELVTPPLEDMVLAGVTRDSILSLAAAHIDPKTTFKIKGLPEKLIVSQRSMNMAEVVRASEDGSLREMFGSGTAAIVSPIEMIGFVLSFLLPLLAPFLLLLTSSRLLLLTPPF